MEFVVEHAGCRLHVTKQGSGKALLLIHGVACDGNYFSEAAEYLARSFMVVTYDRRGYSKSQVLEDTGYGVNEQAEDALAILDALDCERAYVAASSAGCLIALELARKYPERVEKLFLHEPPLGAEESFQKEIEEWQEKLQDAADRGKIATALLRFVEVLGGIDPNAPCKSLKQQAQDFDNLKVFLYKEMQDFLSYVKRNPDNISLEVPCVLAVGEADREGLFSRAGKSAAQYLGCSFLRVPGYHNLASESPSDFAAAVASCLTDSE